MKKKWIINLLFLLLSLLFSGLLILYISHMANHGPYTALVIGKFDYPEEWSHGEVEVAEITEEELDQYPLLQNLIRGHCTKYNINYVNLWRCKVHPDEWNRTKNLIDTKNNTDVCIRIGDVCYIIDFISCCTRDINITDIFVGSCACPPDMPPQQDTDNTLNVIVTIQNNQSASTDMLNYLMTIKNSSNVIMKTKEMMGYIKGNSSTDIITTVTFPGPGEYSLEFQIFENDKMLAQRSTDINVGRSPNQSDPDYHTSN